jgi:hypothetical protein
MSLKLGRERLGKAKSMVMNEISYKCMVRQGQIDGDE